MGIIFREYFKVVWQKKWFFFLCMAAISTAAFLDFYSPVFYKNIANGLAEPFSESTFNMLMENFSMILFFYAGIWIAWRVLEFGIIPLDGGGLNLLEKRCFEVLQKQKYDFFENSHSGSLIKRANRFVRSYEVIMDWFLFQFLFNIISIIVSFIVFYQENTQFAIYFLIWVCVFIAWSILFSIWKLRFDKAVAEADSTVGGKYSDAISNIFIVKSFALEAQEQTQINQASDHVYRKRVIAWILMFVSFAVQGLLTFGIELLLVYLMIQKWKSGNFQVGEFVLFQSILLLLIHRLWEFGRNFRAFFTALADASEMAEVFSREDVEEDNENARPLTIPHGEISFENMNFNYSADNENQNGLFNNFSLKINAGEKVALVGQSGSGKTSLTKLLFRFFDLQSGKICFDGQNAMDFTLESLRKQISLVPQQPELFHRSIRENINLGEAISEEQLIDVAKKSRSLEFINKLPEKFETLVGERGVKLSGGERQRIAIARAFLEDAPVVVLDEATSALDSLTEQQIQVAIFDLIKDKTAIVIAHRLSTILRMDRIIVLEEGKIIEQGSHQQLLKNKCKYHAMWQHQQGDFLIED
ncbi:MAG: ABC transporter ATP-binding protein [Gammaproteobacteria bacterium]|jgi:ATP-binding cassette subfamily B protein|nr:ABC transporter ATP-binding protein [Gammaproteobacteria bacterium]MBT3724223.1 ABC transporter ATP-binding protein [Gammaproteobacteria bacterium]MBT4076271.1 ABC transporter ATP-binding protein [Gammaproteobacteria bacterium]MBT4194926.1 ABC transporter ATP-binding protein [Gammaproteobacteria bacterium]MBT4450736.1 ABC transporter ATP-binding protein [Gammaproteobacteria bacterium]